MLRSIARRTSFAPRRFAARSRVPCSRHSTSLHQQDHHQQQQQQQQHERNSLWPMSVVAMVVAGSALCKQNANMLAACQQEVEKKEPINVDELDDDEYEAYWAEMAGKERPDLPTYTLEELQAHDCPEKGIWVAYKNGVYDIGQWLELHPGGTQKIMTAAGRSLEPFWNMYGQHISGWVFEILESYRIGNISSTEMEKICLTDPYCFEPPRDPRLIVHSEKPFNAEPPAALLADAGFLTPTELFYVRNHLPVPVVDPESYGLVVDTGDLNARFTLDELRANFEPVSVVSAIQCAGNRRSGLNDVKPVKGGMWQLGAISNAEWRGARLRDVIAASGGPASVREALDRGLAHTHFIGLDLDESGEPYAASVPTHVALGERGDVLLAYEMNGEPLPRDHGWPVRAIVPGVVGARNVKWVGEVRLSTDESSSHWQQRDYKGFSPCSTWDKLDWASAPAIQNMPVQSAICWPPAGAKVEPEHLPGANVSVLPNVRGYAYSGAGNKVERVDVSADGGKTWHVATLEPINSSKPEYYGWRRWRVDLPLNEGEKHQLVAKAIDTNYNTQPGDSEAIWNMRGLLNNSWHRIDVSVTQNKHQ